ncbi:hypothetical protein [Alloalcanivorax marinus]|uniref:hypothetical protein n=1 Tax=Alloalcanivorax marinus TaxID=1177169 RepID=UPI0019315640|nr:hypothetical protein [Alloalcanivorax marinus]MBL7252596.1 hypothetical protein [Alloalcanivorax marinus]
MKKPVCFVFLAGVVLLALGGCASKAPFEHEDMERIAVLSLMGDEVDIAYKGATNFGNDRIKVDLSEANLDQIYRTRIEQSLRDHFNYQLVHVDYDRQIWLDSDIEQPFFSLKTWMETPIDRYRPLVSDLARENRLDAVLLLIPLDAYTGFIVEPHGLGIYTGGFNGGVTHATAGIFAGLGLFNGQDGSLVEMAILEANPENPVLDFFSINMFKGRPIKNLTGTDLYRIAKEPITEQHKRELVQLYDDLMADPYLADTVKDVMVSDWAKSSGDTSGSGSSR